MSERAVLTSDQLNELAKDLVSDDDLATMVKDEHFRSFIKCFLLMASNAVDTMQPSEFGYSLTGRLPTKTRYEIDIKIVIKPNVIMPESEEKQ